jgi:hypothetical protein
MMRATRMVSLVIGLLVLAAAGTAEAVDKIAVSIQLTRGTTTVSVPAGVEFTDAGGRTAHSIACNPAQFPTITSATPLCSRTVSVGGTTMTLRDVSTTNRARVYLVDGASSDILNLAGLLAVSGSGITATSAVTLKITYSSSAFTALTYNLYAYTAAMSGNFFNASAARASACLSTTPCLTLKLTANNVTVNQFGDNAIATVNVPAIDSAGGFGPPANPSETKSIPCGNATTPTALTCLPSLQGELIAVYNGPSETLKVLGGAAVGGSNHGITAGGLIDNFVDIVAPESLTGLNSFVSYFQEQTLFATLGEDGASFRNISNSSTVPLSWDLATIANTPSTSEPIVLRSVISNQDLFDDGAHVTFLPTPGQMEVRDITSLTASYLWTFGDCSRSFYVELQLVTLETIRILLGAPSDFLDQCAGNFFSGVDLVAYGDKNVQLPNGSLVSYTTMKGKFGKVGVRGISVFLSPRFDLAGDQEVELTSFTVGAFGTTFTQLGGTSAQPPVPTCDFPGLNEFTMRLTHLDAQGNPTSSSFIYGDQSGETFQSQGCQLRSHVPVLAFPTPTPGDWRMELLWNTVPVGQGTVHFLGD